MRSVYQKLSQVGFIIRKLASYLLKICLRSLYYAYFHSNMCYCLQIWFPLLSKKNQNSLYILQKRIIRSLCGAHPLQHCMPLFKSERILTIYDQLRIENAKIAHRLNYGNCPIPISSLFGKGKCNYNTRSGTMVIRNHLSSKFNKSFLCKTISEWTKIVPALRMLENIKMFAMKLKSDLFGHY